MAVNNNKTIYIYAPNIISGGGLVLLKFLIKCSKFYKIIFFLDARIKNLVDPTAKIIWINSNIFTQVITEYKFSKKIKSGAIFLSFNNRPNLFRTICENFVYLQNYYIINRKNNKIKINFRQRIKFLILKIILLLLRRRNNITYLVQNQFMYNSLIDLNFKESKIFIKPFFDSAFLHDFKNGIKSNHIVKFIYPASFGPHKNHLNLIKAWFKIDVKKLNIELHLTLSHLDLAIFLEMISLKYEDLKNYNIFNHGFLEYNDSLILMSSMNCLIYPSLFESFGLPLIEANEIGLDILASELDYVRDLSININESFDPNSSLSINRAILRYLDVFNNNSNILDPNDFLDDLIE